MWNRRSRQFSAVARRLFAAEISRFEVPGGGDQTQVAERLREVPEQLAGARVDLLGHQPDVVYEAAEVLEERLGSFAATCPRESADKPERPKVLLRPEVGRE
jgi:hypothetical protein